MISNRFYICITLLTVLFILSSCLGSDDNNRVEYDYSSDAQITSFSLQSYEDTLKVLPSVKFSINQVASAPVIFNRDSLPYLFDVSNVKMNVRTNGASGIKLHLINPDSTYIWDMNDSVKIKSLKHIEVYAADGVTSKMYTFKLNTHQQDPDAILWQNVSNNYIDTPTDQVTIASASNFYTYYKTGESIALSTFLIDDGEVWIEETVTGLPQNVVFKSIQNDTFGEVEVWYALDTDNKVYLSEDGVDWIEQATDLPVISIFGKMPSYSVDSVLVVLKDEDVYKFAKTMDFSSLHLLNEIPTDFPIDNFTTTTVENAFTVKQLITTGGENIDGIPNKNIWLLQENEGKITYIKKEPNFNVAGSSLFKYDDKIYLMAPENGKNVFYTSISYGAFWDRANSKQSLPSEFLYRKNQSVNVDDKNNIWIFGGVSANQSQLVEVWKGRINKLFLK